MVHKELIFCVEKILLDLRGNWADDPGSRAELARTLALRAGLNNHVVNIDEYIKKSNDQGDWDARWFRCPYKEGGYEEMEQAHGLPNRLSDKSKECADIMRTVITYPNFEDWNTG